MNQNQVRLLIGAIIIVVILSVGFLYKENIMTLFNNKAVPTPVINTSAQKPAAPKVDLHRRLIVQSGIAGYQLILENEFLFVKTLEENHIYGRRYVTNFKSTSGMYPLNEIQLIVRDKIESSTPDYGNNAYVYFQDGLMQVNLIYTKEELGALDAEQKILSSFVGTIYKMVYKTATDDEVNNKVDEIIKTIEKDGKILRIKKI